MLLLAELELLFEADWLLVTLELFDEVLLPTLIFVLVAVLFETLLLLVVLSTSLLLL